MVRKKIVNCCKKFLLRDTSLPRAVLCLKWVLPLRILALSSVAISATYTVTHQHSLSPLESFLAVTHLVIVWVVLSECRRSSDYHKMIRDYAKEDKRAARMDTK